jgi:Peptidase family M28
MREVPMSSHGSHRPCVTTTSILWLLLALAMVAFPVAAQRDPVEPSAGRPAPKLLPRPAGAIARSDVDEADMRSLIEQLVACGTRNTLSSWSDTRRGIGCARDHIVTRLNQISQASGGRLQIVVDKFEAGSGRTGPDGKTVSLENVYGILPGNDPALSKTVFIVSGHMDSRASDVMNPELDSPGADDDASGVAVSMECARLLSRLAASGASALRGTLIFAAVSGEEQGLLGSTHMVKWVLDQGYTVGWHAG